MNGEPLLDTAALQSKLDDPRLRVFDATLHFASDGKTRSGLSDWEAGHIPGFRSAGRIAGSQNAPFTDVLDPETGTLLGEDALREFFEVGDAAIKAYTDDENANSRRLAEHLGFEVMDASRD